MDISGLFSHLTAADIRDFIANQQEENLYLEFKNVKGASFNSSDDKRNYAKALSGFANSSGGLIIWGVDARKGPNDVDCAQLINEIEPVGQLVARLNELTGLSVTPAIDGVQHRAIEMTKNKGVVLSLVPESDVGPHMAKAGEDRYYKRSGDSFYRLEHFDIADMFGRRAHPVLGLRRQWDVRFYQSGGGAAVAALRVGVIIENHGRGLARFPAVTLGTPSWRASDWLGKNGGRLDLPLVRAPEGWWLRYAGGADVVIYPQDEFQVASVTFHILNSQTYFEDLCLPVWVVAAGAQPVRTELRIGADEICDSALRAFTNEGLPFRGISSSKD
jgi:hypothetical protein